MDAINSNLKSSEFNSEIEKKDRSDPIPFAKFENKFIYSDILNIRVKEITDEKEKLKFHGLFATALCLEFATIKKSQDLINTFRNYEKLIPFEKKLLKDEKGLPMLALHLVDKSDCPPGYEMKNIEIIECLGICETTSETFDSEAFIFYYKTILNIFKNKESPIPFNISKSFGMKAALQTTNSNIRASAEQLYIFDMRQILYKEMRNTFIEILEFYRHCNILPDMLFNILKETLFFNTIKKLIIELENSTKTGNKNIENYAAFHFPGIIEKIENLVIEWRFYSADILNSFENNQNNILTQRSKSKDKVRFIQNHMKHSYTFIKDIQFNNFIVEFNKFNNNKEELKIDVSIESNFKCKKIKKTKKNKSKNKSQNKIKIKKSVVQDEQPSNININFDEIKYNSKVKPLNYDQRVLEWFKKEPKHLKRENYINLSEEDKKKQHLYHGFTLAMDQFLKEYACTSTWENQTTDHQDELFVIPGEIKRKGKAAVRGFFTYAKGVDDRIYHRHFTERMDRDLIFLGLSSFDRIDFPTLKQANELTDDATIFEELPIEMNATIKKHKIFGSLHILDNDHNAELILYPRC